MKMENLKKLEASHEVKWDEDFQQRKYDGLERYANVDDVKLKRAGKDTLEGFANALILMSERAEQEAIRKNPPKNDRAYVERADYPITSLYSDYKDEIEADNKTWADYREERNKWRRCKYMYCLNVFPINRDNFKDFPAKRKDSRFCCEECRKSQNEANNRMEKYGSYLPRDFYLPAQSEYVSDRERRNVHASDAETIEREINVNRPLRKVPVRRKVTEVSPVITYNLADLSKEEIRERKLQNFAQKYGKSRREIPYITRAV